MVSGRGPASGASGASVLVLVAVFCVGSVLASVPPDPAAADSVIRIGLNADMSSVNLDVGVALERGALLAIEEINERGGVLGRQLELVVRDHRRNPARGEVNVRELAADPQLVAILGGKHTPVILAGLDTIHELGVPYLIAWAAGTPLIDHDHEPSYTFRLSVHDADAAGVLVEHALGRGFGRFGLLLEQTAWGRSNERALVEALAGSGLSPVRIEWFSWSQVDFEPALERFRRAGADVVIFVGNTPEGVWLLRSLQRQAPGERLPVVSHWGVTGAEFEQELESSGEGVDVAVLTTFSFAAPPYPERAAPLLERYLVRFTDGGGLRDVPAHPATAQAYDLTHVLARAIEEAGTTERAAVRDALERVEYHAGVMRDYAPPFTPERHEALMPTDLRLARFEDGIWLPIESPP